MSILTLTPAAEKQIDLLSKENDCYGITLNIKGGGCAGFEYDWGTIASPTELEDGDEVVKTANGCASVSYTHLTLPTTPYV